MNLTEKYDSVEYGVFARGNQWVKLPEKKPIIEHILYEGDVICISSRAGVGKSVLSQQLMCCLTTATPFLDTYSIKRPFKVLYVQSEGDRAETLERLSMIRKHINLDDMMWAHYNVPGIAFNIDSEFSEFKALLDEIDFSPEVIIIDPLYTTIKGDMNKNETATDWIRNIRKLKGWYSCAIVVLNHEGKDMYVEGTPINKGNGEIFGSTFWAAFFNHNYKLKVFDGHHLLEVGKNRSGKAVDRVAMRMLTDDTLVYVPYDPDLTENGLKIIAAIKNGLLVSANKIIKDTGVSKAQVYRILGKLEKEGKIFKEESTKGAVYGWKEDKRVSED